MTSPVIQKVMIFRLTCHLFQHPSLYYQSCYIIRVQLWLGLCGRSQKSAQHCTEVAGESSKFRSVSCQHRELVSALRLSGGGASVVHASLLASRSKAYSCDVISTVNTSIVFISTFLFHFFRMVRASRTALLFSPHICRVSSKEIASECSKKDNYYH